MRVQFAVALCAMSALLFAMMKGPGESRSWALVHSTLTYHMSHPIHEVEGVSEAAHGKGVCQSGQCDFLIAAPVKSFTSGDTNRDLHMVQVTRGAEFPLITVKVHIPEANLASSELNCDLEVEFAGKVAHYSHVPFHQLLDGPRHHLTGVVPATLTDFKINPPSFLTVPIRNEIPVRVDMVWQPS